MKIQIENSQRDIRINRRRIRSSMIKLLRHLSYTDKEVSIMFVNDDKISRLNKFYLNKDKPTNVLSFSLQEGEYSQINPHLLGDIVISVNTALKDAVKGGFSLEQEIDFLIIHGLLHLLGYNHENTTEAEARKMRIKEKELMKLLNCLEFH
jgi:probable rRNA maturation factor